MSVPCMFSPGSSQSSERRYRDESSEELAWGIKQTVLLINHTFAGEQRIVSYHSGSHKFIKTFLLETRLVVQTCLSRSQRIKAGGSQVQGLLGLEDSGK